MNQIFLADIPQPQQFVANARGEVFAIAAKGYEGDDVVFVEAVSRVNYLVPLTTIFSTLLGVAAGLSPYSVPEGSLARLAGAIRQIGRLCRMGSGDSGVDLAPDEGEKWK